MPKHWTTVATAASTMVSYNVILQMPNQEENEDDETVPSDPGSTDFSKSEAQS